MSGLSGSPSLRARWRDRIANIDAAWLYSATEMAAWRAWYEDDLLNGQLWFAMASPGEGGLADRVFKFRTPSVRREALGNGIFRVSAQLQQRGRTAAPVAYPCFTERFDDGLTPYTSNSGDTSIYSLVDGGLNGNALRVAAQNGGSAYRQRVLPTPLTARRFAGNFKIASLAADDSCGAYLHSAGGAELCGFQPRAAAGNDAAQRATFFLGSDFVRMGAAALEANTWYRFQMLIITGVEASTCEITRVGDGAVIAAANMPGNHSPVAAANLRFFIDSAALTCVTWYDNVVACSA